MVLKVVVEYDEEAKAWSAVCPQLPGCASCGATEEEALVNVKEAIELYLEPDDSGAVNANAHVYEVAV